MTPRITGMTEIVPGTSWAASGDKSKLFFTCTTPRPWLLTLWCPLSRFCPPCLFCDVTDSIGFGVRDKLSRNLSKEKPSDLFLPCALGCLVLQSCFFSRSLSSLQSPPRSPGALRWHPCHWSSWLWREYGCTDGVNRGLDWPGYGLTPRTSLPAQAK